MLHEIKMEGHSNVIIKGVIGIEELESQFIKLKIDNDEFDTIKISGYGLRLLDYNSGELKVIITGCIIILEHDKESK